MGGIAAHINISLNLSAKPKCKDLVQSRIMFGMSIQLIQFIHYLGAGADEGRTLVYVNPAQVVYISPLSGNTHTEIYSIRGAVKVRGSVEDTRAALIGA